MSMTRCTWFALGGALLLLTPTGARAWAEEPSERTIQVTAKKFEFSPDKIVLKKGVPVTLELTSLDRKHGFVVPELGIRTDVKPNQTARVRVKPTRAGSFGFHCDVFCGDGHEGMAGQIVVEP